MDSLDDLLDQPASDDYYDHDWLERNYGGAPDECSQCYREGKLIKVVDCTEHN